MTEEIGEVGMMYLNEYHCEKCDVDLAIFLNVFAGGAIKALVIQ